MKVITDVVYYKKGQMWTASYSLKGQREELEAKYKKKAKVTFTIQCLDQLYSLMKDYKDGGGTLSEE